MTTAGKIGLLLLLPTLGAGASLAVLLTLLATAESDARFVSVGVVVLDVALLVLGLWLVATRVVRPARHLVEAARRTRTEVEDAHRRARDDLLARDRALWQVLDAITDLVFVKGPQSSFVWANKAFRDHHGVTLEQLTRSDAASFDEPDLVARRLKDDATVFATGQSVATRDERSIRQDGKVVSLDVVKSPIFDDEGKVALLVGVARDISERKAVEESRARLAEAVAQAAEAIVITGADGTISYVNPAFEHCTGYSLEEVVGKNPRLLKSGRQDAGFYRQMWATLTRGETWRGRMTNRRKDGSTFDEDASISPLRDALGNTVSYVAVKRDLTRESDLEGQLRHAQKMEAVGRVAGGVAHDFNNLLTAINGYSELALGRLSAHDPMRREIEEIGKAGTRAVTLTKQLLAFSRKKVPQPMALDINSVVEDLVSMLRRLIGEDVELVAIPGSSLGCVRADPGQLEQVLVNLSVNARDAMPQGGRLTIETSNVDLGETYASQHAGVVAGPHVLLAVTDTGTGMTPETKARIFEPFFTTKEPGKGTGLGLSTVHGIVKQSGGHVAVRSEVGRGTTFEVYLPCVGAAPDLPPASGPYDLLPRGTETVLLVEDEKQVRELVRSVLEGNGYTVLEASSGGEALHLHRLHSGAIHLLLTDVVLPEMGGQQLAGSLAATRPSMRVLYVSGYTADTLVRRGVLHAGMAFLQKPFTTGALAREVRVVLDARRPPPAVQPTTAAPARDPAPRRGRVLAGENASA